MNDPVSTPDVDCAQRFMFEDYGIRGEIVRLGSSLETILGQHFYPAPVAGLLGEMLTASALLSYTLKFDGSLSLQARSDGVVGLIFAECANQKTLRGYARVNDEAMAEGVDQLLRGGTLAITIMPDNGHHYQGIVPLDSSELSACIEHYFEQSEQLPTALMLYSDGAQAAGVLIQALPKQASNSDRLQENWQHVSSLLRTLTGEELLSVPFETLLFRLFHQEKVRLFEQRDLGFSCRCSMARAEQAVRSIGADEAQSVLEEKGEILIQCEFCQAEYRLVEGDMSRLFPAQDAGTLH